MKIKLIQDVVLNNILKSKGMDIEVANPLGIDLINQGKAIDLSGKFKKQKTTTKINKK